MRSLSVRGLGKVGKIVPQGKLGIYPIGEAQIALSRVGNSEGPSFLFIDGGVLKKFNQSHMVLFVSAHTLCLSRPTRFEP
jgi:hypothetical protein